MLGFAACRVQAFPASEFGAEVPELFTNQGGIMTEWNTDKRQPYFIRSKCGRWQISKSLYRDDARYALWDLRKRDEPAEIFSTLADAKSRAETK
jgi:hypothetical protein